VQRRRAGKPRTSKRTATPVCRTRSPGAGARALPRVAATASCGPARLLFARYRPGEAMNENFSLIVMCLFLLGSLAFLAQQLTSYH